MKHWCLWLTACFLLQSNFAAGFADQLMLPSSPILRVVGGGIKKAAHFLKGLVPGLGTIQAEEHDHRGGQDDHDGHTLPTHAGDDNLQNDVPSEEHQRAFGAKHSAAHGGQIMPTEAGGYNPKRIGHSDHRRPFFIIGHMVNSIEEVDEFLARGSNALEADIEFAKDGTVLGTYHGTPCDCFRGCFQREKMADFLSHVRDVSSLPHSKYKGKMILLFLDLKTTQLPDDVKVKAGVTLAQNLMDHLWKGVAHEDRINVLMSIGYARDRDVIRGAIAYLKQKGDPRVLEKLGFDVGMNDPLSLISRMYRRIGIREHRWQGDGLTNCMRFIMPVDRLLKAIRWRDTDRGYMDKVYHWTIDLPYFIAKSIRHGVDGIITNRPENVRKVVESATFRGSHKVADARDSPWTRFHEYPEDLKEDTDTSPEILGGE